MSKKLNVMLIDDDILALSLNKIVAAKSGIFESIITMQAAQDAIDYLCKYQLENQLLPDYIILDLNMPIMDGWDFIDKFIFIYNKINKNICIYILSSTINPDDYRRLQEIGLVKQMLAKPLSKNMLFEMTGCENPAIEQLSPA